jgi:serine/threonine protein kinase/formylglycine-generating enzyme required for sulfatase activity
MNDQPHAAAESLSRSLLQRIDELCDRFENAWQAGQRPAIEEYLGDTAEPSHSLLLRELLGLELQYRCQNGEVLDAEDYVARFPAHANLIRKVFVEEISGERTSVSSPSEHRSDTKPDATKGEVDHPERLGRYRITGTLGCGSFGVVYKGYDEELRREVAIKVPHRHRVSQPEDVEAYLAEARVLASLDHPHIVPVYDAGRIGDNLCYVVSKFIEGSDLRTRIKGTRPSVQESAELVATVAEALHSAHERRLVHRDVKPANILLGRSNKPYLTDFGLALREEDFGRGGLILGTPAYMSPEQANGEGHLVDGRSDIFSLGVVFYELLTGRRPFVVSDDLDLLRLILSSTEVRPPRQLDATIPRELERICLKALAKQASERYTTAFDLADDLHHWLAKTAEMAAHDSAVYLKAPVKIVPKGLRSFDAEDTDFFLELLPGPRDREGLPDSIRFWKTRIEETDPDQTFTVGLIYGPSGCGKTSLVKAGLLPRLSQDVTAVYIESTANETESRLLSGLGKRFPSLTAHLDLRATLAALRRRQGLPAGKKVLIILDQFEQWLHAKREEEYTELVQALRQCDGGRVQCLVMVRDDFWMAVVRFMRGLDNRLVETQNSAVVDLFPIRHAENVLAAFGRAFGVLPENSTSVSNEQKRFLQQAVSDLAQENRVICVRLALFAEMMKGKPWTPASLKEVGGTAGVGVSFLEETFSATTAPPEHRYHQKAARAVLKALLPESGTDIKGHMRSYQELLEASGYASRPKKTSAKNFDDLIHILDSELRLITATDPEGAARQQKAEMAGEDRRLEGEGREGTSASSVPSVSPRFYQLTHDYLVHSLRDWLNREEQATMQGRARLLLKDLAALYSGRPENRQLPSFLQWVRIRILTSKRAWTGPQRRMMRKAGRYHAKRGLLLTVLLLVATLGGLVAYLETYRANRAAGLVRLLKDADIGRVPGFVDELEPYRYWANALLEETNNQATPESREKLNTAIALLPVELSQAEYLYDRMLDADLDFGQLPKPNVIRVILDSAAKHPAQGELRDRILMRLGDQVGARPPPDAKDDVKDKVAKKQAKAAVALLRMEQPEQVWPLLKHSPDPRVRSYLIHLLGPSGVEFKVIRQQLNLQSDVTIRRALLLSLGDFNEEDIAADERDTFVNDLHAWYTQDADPGLHGAVEWLLRQWNQGQWLKETNEKWASQKPWREERLESIRRAFAERGRGHLVPQWYVNSQGQTMVVIPGSVEFMMGSPLTEEGRGDDERTPQRRSIGHHFAIAAKSVTVDQFRRFLKNHNPQPSSLEPDWPVSKLSWYQAAEYCNWLSDQEGLERCYEPNKEGKYDEGMKPLPDCLDRTGYRLPAEEEWECACRAGAVTSRYYGESVELLRKYGWYVENSRSRSWNVATLKPNDWGLFDMHGNVWTWCQDQYKPSKTEKRIFRGGSYVDAARDVRAARRLRTDGETVDPYLGLRPARTLR